MEEKVALKSGYYLMIFNKNDIPFFDKLIKSDITISKDNITYFLYQAPNPNIAEKVDNLMDSTNSGIGFYIDDYIIENNITI